MRDLKPALFRDFFNSILDTFRKRELINYPKLKNGPYSKRFINATIIVKFKTMREHKTDSLDFNDINQGIENKYVKSYSSIDTTGEMKLTEVGHQHLSEIELQGKSLAFLLNWHLSCNSKLSWMEFRNGIPTTEQINFKQRIDAIKPGL
jgi:hypothetical protein